MLVKYFKVDIPIVFFGGYCVSIFLIFLGVYLFSRLLFDRREIAFLSLLFLLFSPRAFAGARALDYMFLTRGAVLPILLISIHLFVSKKYCLSFICLGIGFLIHPMTSIYVALMLTVASVIELKKIGVKKFLFSFVLLILFSSPMIIWKLLYSPPSLSFFYADPEWVRLLRLRSSHHLFPFSWRWEFFLKAGLLVALFFLALKYKPSEDYHRVVKHFVFAIFGMSVAGTIFSEIVPVAFVLNLQLLRSFVFFVYFVMVYFSNLVFKEIESGRGIVTPVALVVLGVAAFYGGETYYGHFCAVAIGVVVVLGFYLIVRSKFGVSLPCFVFCLLVVVLVWSGYGYIVRENSFSIHNAQERSWLDVQRWAKSNTNVGDVFIVPPYTEGFRVESERGIYGDWKDGTLMNFNPDFGREWFRRMRKIGLKSINQSINQRLLLPTY